MNFETIIGLEIHVELATKSKIFCSCRTEFGAKPNKNTCPICLGFPGTMPVLKEEVVNLTVKAGKILNSFINRLSKIDRKNYFYPDLPKAYQTSRFDMPICSGGYVDIEVEGIKRRIRLNRIHMEEDAGKLVHLEDEGISLIDYNRVGIPLLEIVTEPDMRSPEEAVAFLKALKVLLEYGEISDCRMEQGSLRCDGNISLRKIGQDSLNTRVELKNLNSFKELHKALENEEKRRRFAELYGLKDKDIDILIGDKALARYYEALTACGTNPRTAANWVLGNMLKQLNEKELETDRIPVKPEVFFRLTELIDKGEISITAAQEVFGEMLNTGKSADQVVKEKELGQISDAMVLKGMIMGVLNDNPHSMIDYKAGKTQAAGVLMGQVMKASKGKANPQLAKALLDELLKV